MTDEKTPPAESFDQALVKKEMDLQLDAEKRMRELKEEPADKPAEKPGEKTNPDG